MARRHIVLVAEDDELVRDLINTVLVGEGYSVLLASDGEEALELSRSYAGEIDLIVSDVIMPRMDGLRLTANVRAERPGIRSLLMSGKLGSEALRQDREIEFLRKPFVPDQLRKRLREILRQSPD